MLVLVLGFVDNNGSIEYHHTYPLIGGCGSTLNVKMAKYRSEAVCPRAFSLSFNGFDIRNNNLQTFASCTVVIMMFTVREIGSDAAAVECKSGC